MKHILYSLVTLFVLSFTVANANDLTFSSTQQLDKKLQQFVGMPSTFSINWKEITNLPDPPSEELEVKYIHMLQKKLTDERIERIKEQQDINFSYLEPKILELKATNMLMQMLYQESGVVVLGQKLKFDRVRPEYVSPKIMKVIKVPDHPAYPSGHATQSHLYAYVLSALNPPKVKDYLALANEITENREYAGVHYRSDSYTGQQLAKFMVQRLAHNEEFQRFFFAAADEWGGDGVKKLQSLLALSMAHQ
jgi:acid phosphatase (class A)